MPIRVALLIPGALIAGVLLTSCAGPTRKSASALTGGDPARGAARIPQYGCGACHSIPGIPGAHGIVGPPLAGLGARMYVGGVLPNQPENAVLWIRNPKSVNQRTAMPNVGVTERDATDIVTYLYSLK